MLKSLTLKQRESWFAFGLLTPTMLIVLSIILLPLAANFWISTKPIELADLRPPQVTAFKRVKAEDAQVSVRYTLRNSSQEYRIDNVRFIDALPTGAQLIGALPDACSIEQAQLTCDYPAFEAKQRERFTLTFSDTSVDALKTSSTQLQFEQSNPLISKPFTFENFERVFHWSEFNSVLWVSFVYTIGSTAGALLLGLGAALVLKDHFPGRGFVRGLLLFPYVAPVIAVAFTWVTLLDPTSGTVNSLLIALGILDAPINFLGQRATDLEFLGMAFEWPVALSSVIAFEAWRYFPLSFLFILARMASISDEMYEAAEIDGATPTQQFRFLSLPMLGAILAVLFLLRFIWNFNKFDDIFLLTGGAAGTRTLTVSVYEQAIALGNIGAGSAVAVLVFFVLLVCSLAIIRFSPKEQS